MFSGRTQYRPFSWGLSSSNTAGGSRPTSAGVTPSPNTTTTSGATGGLVASGSKYNSNSTPSSTSSHSHQPSSTNNNNTHQPAPPSTATASSSGGNNNTNIKTTTSVTGGSSNNSHVQQYRVGGGTTTSPSLANNSPSDTSGTYHPSGSAINVLRTNSGGGGNASTTAAANQQPSSVTNSNRYGFHPSTSHNNNSAGGGTSLKGGGASSSPTFTATTSLLPTNPQIRSVNVINPSGMSRDQHTRLQQMLLAVGSAVPADGANNTSASSTTSAAGRGFRAGGSRTLSPSAVAGGKDGATSSLLLPSAIPALVEASAVAESQWARGMTSVPESHHDANGEEDQLNNTANSVVTLTGSQSGHSTPRGEREGSQGGVGGGGPRQSPSSVKSAVYELQSRLRSVELFHLWMVAPETQRDLAALVSDQRAKMNKTANTTTATTTSSSKTTSDVLHITPEPPLSKLWAPSSQDDDNDGGMVRTDATAAEERASSSSPTADSLTNNTRLPTPSLAVDKGAVSPVGSPLSPALIHEDKPAQRASGGLMSLGGGSEEPSSPFVPPIKPTVSSSSPKGKGAEGAAVDLSGGGLPLMSTTSAEGLESGPRESPARRRPGGPEVPLSPHTPSEAARKGSPLPAGPNHSFRRSPHHLKSNEFTPGSLNNSASLSPRPHLQVDEMDALHAKGRISPRREAPPPEHHNILKASTGPAATKATVGVVGGAGGRKDSLEPSESFKLDDDDTPNKTTNTSNLLNNKKAVASNLDASFKLEDNNSKATYDDDSDVSSVATADDDPLTKSQSGAAKNNKPTKKKSSGKLKSTAGTMTPASSNKVVELPAVKQATIKDIPPFYFPRGKPVNKNGVGASTSSIRTASAVASKTAAAPTLLVLRGATYNGHEDPHLRPFAGLALPMGQQLQADQLPGHEGLSNAQLSPTRQQRKKAGGGSTSPGGTATGGGNGAGNDVVEDVQLFTEDGTPIPGYKLAPLAILKGYVDSDQLGPALTKVFASVPAVPTPPPPAPAGALSSSSIRAPSAQGSRLGSRAGGAGAAGVSRLGGTRPGTAANLRATEQQNYIKAETAYRQALYATMCKVCTDYLGLPKYFAVPIMKLLISTSTSSPASSSPTSSPQTPSQVPVKEGIPVGSITAASVKEFFDTWLSGKDILRRMFDTLIACSSVSHLAPSATSTSDDSATAAVNTITTRNYLVKEDFLVYFQSLLDHHPGLAFLHQTVDFQQKYLETIAVRIFYSLDVRDTKRISWKEFEASKLPDAIRQVDHTDDINTVLNFFSYEHFYVVYCRFWELDKNQEMKLTRADLARYFPEGAANPLVIDRVFSGKGRKLAGALTHQQQAASSKTTASGARGGRGGSAVGRGVGVRGGITGRGGRGGGVGSGAQEVPMTYEDFVWFCLAEEDKASPRSIRYWFNILDLDGDGLISGFELESFYQSTRMSMMSITTEAISFEDIMCQITDMVPALAQNYKEYRGPSPSSFKSILAASSSSGKMSSAAAPSSPTVSSNDVLGGWIRRTASTGKRSLMSLDGSAASKKRGSIGTTKALASKAAASPPPQPPMVASVRRYLDERSKWEAMQLEKFDANSNNNNASPASSSGGGAVDPLAKYHKYGLTLSDLLRNPTNAYVALNMVLNAIKFLQFEQRDPYVLHQDRLMGGFEGNEWDRFARAEYDRMAAEAE